MRTSCLEEFGDAVDEELELIFVVIVFNRLGAVGGDEHHRLAHPKSESSNASECALDTLVTWNHYLTQHILKGDRPGGG